MWRAQKALSSSAIWSLDNWCAAWKLSGACTVDFRMSAVQTQDALAKTVIGFSRDGVFPEEDEVSAMYVQSSALPATLEALAGAKEDLEVRSSSCISTSSYI